MKLVELLRDGAHTLKRSSAMKVIIHAFFITLLLGFAAQSVTADGLPPSGESVCDGLQEPGITGGLFGLCNAFCEAKDCDEYPAGEEPRSCQRILANYERKRDRANNPMDPEMPCLEEPSASCPCWTPDEFAARGEGYTPFLCDMAPPEDNVIYVDFGSGMSVVFAAIDTPMRGCQYMNDAQGIFRMFDDEDPEFGDDENAACEEDVAVLQAEFNQAGVSCF